MNRKVLAIVFTPLQYVNAKKFLRNNQCSDDSLILILASDKENVDPILEIVGGNCKLPFQKLTFLSFNITMILKAIYIKWFILRGDYDQVVIGSYNNIIAYFAGCFFYKKNKDVFLVDDGFATIAVFHNRNVEKKLNFNLNRGRIIKIVAFILNVKPSVLLPKLTFYSHFKLNTGSKKKIDSVVQARLKVNAQVKRRYDKSLCYFMGGPYVEKEMISLSDFKHIMKQIKERYAQNGITVKYCLHRFENEKPIGLEQIRFNKNIETVFEKELQHLPKHLCAFYSTALFNLAYIYPSINCIYYNITGKLKSGYPKKNIKLIYTYLSNDELLKDFNKSSKVSSK